MICRWSTIAAHLPGRTDNEIKNYWNTYLKKRLLQLGIDPVTHSPCRSSDLEMVETSSAEINNLSSLLPSPQSHISQWDRVRMETEARLSSNNAFSKATQPGSSVYDHVSDAGAFISSWKAAESRHSDVAAPGILSEFGQSTMFHQGLRFSSVPPGNAWSVASMEAASSSTSRNQDDNRHSPGSSSSISTTSYTSHHAKLLNNPMSPTSILSEPVQVAISGDLLWNCNQEGAGFWHSQVQANPVHDMVTHVPNCTLPETMSCFDHQVPLLETGYRNSVREDSSTLRCHLLPESFHNFYSLADFGPQYNSQAVCRVQKNATRLQQPI